MPAMYTPSQLDVRRFFCATYRQWQAGAALDPMQKLAQPWVAEHPEYFAELADEATALALEYRVEDGQTNPFLHLSLHLAVEEQLSIDQPPGIRAAFDRLLARRGDRHDALHAILECLGETVFRSARDRAPPDADAYLECIRRAAGG